MRVYQRNLPQQVLQESPTAFLHKLDNEEEDFSKPMRFVADSESAETFLLRCLPSSVF